MEEEKTQDIALNLVQSNFKVKFSRITTVADYEKYKKCVCEICFQSNSEFFPEGDEKGIKMMTCYGCSVKCHAYCYGIETQICEESLKNKPKTKIIYFLCQKCRQEPKKEMICAICNIENGALKKIENSDEWIHVTCGLFSEGLLCVNSYKTMTFSKLNDKPIEKDKNAKYSCSVCLSNVGIKKCFEESCNEHAHVYCTLKSKQEKQSKQEIQVDEDDDQEEVSEGWCIRMTYSNNPIFDISSISNISNSCDSTVASSVKPNFTQLLSEHLREISAIIDPKLKDENEKKPAQPSVKVPAAAAKKSARAGRRKQSVEETDQTDIKCNNPSNGSQNGEKPTSILLEIAASIASKFKERQDNQIVSEESTQIVAKKPKGKGNKDQESQIIKGSVTQTNPLMGGDLALECQTHRRQDVYCVCQKIDSSENMVFCELCSNKDIIHTWLRSFYCYQLCVVVVLVEWVGIDDWYHYSCVKYTEKQGESDYLCLMCTEWYAHKKKKLLKEYTSGKAETFDIMVANIPKLNLMDFISVMLFVDTRIHNMLFTAKKSNIDNQIKDAISVLSFIPLISSKISDILVFKSRKFIVEAVDEFLEAVAAQTSFLRISSAVAISDSKEGFTVLEDIQKQNEGTKKIIDDIASLFITHKMKEKGVLMSLKKQMNWINKAHQSFFRKNTDKVSSALLNDLIKEDDEIISKWTEFSLIENTLSQSRTWQTKIVSLYESTISMATQKMEIEDSTAEKDKKEITEEEYITRKYQLWRERISIKPTIDELDSLIYEGRESIIDNVQELKKLEQEKEEISIWCQQLEEQERNATIILNQKLKNDEKAIKTDTKVAIASNAEQMEIEGEKPEKDEEPIQIENKPEKQEETKPTIHQQQQDGGDKYPLDLQSRIYKNSGLMVKGDFELFAMQMMTKIVPQIPKMNEIINMLEIYEKNELRWVSIIEYVNEKKAIAQNGQQISMPINVKELITEVELKEIMESSLNLEMRIPYIGAIQTLLNELLEEKQRLQTVLASPFEQSEYINARSNFPSYFSCEEQLQISTRLAYFKEISDLIENKFTQPTPEQLEMYQKISEGAQFPQNIVEFLSERLAVTTPITQGILEIIMSGIVESKQIEQTKEYLNQMKLVKVNFRKEMEIIRIMQKSDKWLRNLHKIFYNTKVEFVNQEPVVSVLKEIDLEVEEELEAKSIGECVEEMKEKWQLFKTVLQLRNEQVPHLREGLAVEFHYDTRIKQILTLLCDDVWTFQTEPMIVSSESNPEYRLTFESLYSLLQNAQFFQISSENLTLKKLIGMQEVALKEKQIEMFNSQQLEAVRLQQLRIEQEANEKKKQLLEKAKLLESEDDDDEEDDEDGDDDDEDDDDEDDEDDDDEDEDEENSDSGNSSDNDSSVRIYDEDESENLEGLSEVQKKRVIELKESGKTWNEKVNQFVSIIEKCSIETKKEKSIEIEDLNLISFSQLKSSLSEGYRIISELLQIGSSVDFMKKRMCKLEETIVSVHNYFLEVNKKRANVDSIDESKKILNCIDVSDILIEFRVNLSTNPETQLSLKSLIKMPFKNLHTFKIVYNANAETTYFSKSNKEEHIVLETAAVLSKQKKKEQKNSNANKILPVKGKLVKSRDKQAKEIIELESQDNNSESRQGISLRQKSNRNKGKTMDSDFVYGSSYVKQFTKEEPNRQKSKVGQQQQAGSNASTTKDGSNSNKSKGNQSNALGKDKKAGGSRQSQNDQLENSRNQNSASNNIINDIESESDNDDDYDSANLEQQIRNEVVTDENRKIVQEKLRKILQQNQIFVKQQCSNSFKSIENQIFGDYHKNRKKYLEKAATYVKLFQKLNNYPLISKKIMIKNFQIQTLDKLVNSQLDSLENNINIQIKQQQLKGQITTNPTPSTQPHHPSQPAHSSASAATSNTAATPVSQKPVSIGSSKEPQLQKKIKPIDPIGFPSLLLSQPSSSSNSNKQQNNPMSALQMLLSSNDQSKESSTASSSNQTSKKEERRSGHESSSSHHRSKNDSSYSSSRHHNDSKKSQSSKYSSSSSHSHSRKRDHGNFSDESSSDEKQYRHKSSKTENKRSGKISPQNRETSSRHHPESSVSKSTNNDSNHNKQQIITTPKASMNKSDCEDIDEILNTYTSDSKVYQFDLSNGGATSQLYSLPSKEKEGQNQNQEFLFNPDADGDITPIDEEKQDLQELNKQYFDQDDELQIRIPLADDKSEGNQLEYQIKNTKQSVESPSKDSKLKDNKIKLKQTTSSEMEIEEKPVIRQEVDIPTPSDSVIRVCKCKLRTNKGQLPISAVLYTLDSVAQLKKFPVIDVSKPFDLIQQSDFNIIKSYLEKQVNKSIIILKGWIELASPKNDSKRILEVINQQDLKEKVFGFKMNGMTFNIFTEHLISKTDYRFKPKHVNSDNQLTIPVIIYQKKSDHLDSNLKTNIFKFVKFSLNPQTYASKAEEKRKQIEHQQIISPAGSDIEDDDDNKTSINKKDSIFDEKTQNQESSSKNNNNSTPIVDKTHKISLLELQDIDLQSLQLQLQDIPSSNPTPPPPPPPPSTLPQENKGAIPPYHPNDPRVQVHYGQNHGGYANRNAPQPIPPQYSGYQQGYMHVGPAGVAPPPPPPHLIGHPGYPHQPQPQHPQQHHIHHLQAPQYVPPPPLQPPPPGPTSITAPIAPVHMGQHLKDPVEKQNQVNKSNTEIKSENDSTNKADDSNMEIEGRALNIDFDQIDFDLVQNLLEKESDPTPINSDPQIQAIPQQQPVDKQNQLPPHYLPRQPYPQQNNQSMTPHYGPPPGKDDQQQHINSQYPIIQPPQNMPPYYQNYAGPKTGAPQHQPHPSQQQQQQQQQQQPPQWDPAIQGQQSYPPRGPVQGQPTGQPPQKYFNYNVNPNRDVGSKNQPHLPGQNIPPQYINQNSYPQGQNQNRNYPFNPPHSGHQGGAVNNQNGYQDMRNAPRPYGHHPQHQQNFNPSMTSPTQGQQMNKYPRAQNMPYNNPSTQPGGGPQNQNQKMNPQQYNKNQFGSRQQAHYQRNNQPYTAHNPVPLIDPVDDRGQQQQFQTQELNKERE